MSKRFGILAAGLAAALISYGTLASGSAQAQAPTLDYTLNGTYAAQGGVGPSLTSLGGTLGATGYTFTANQGLSLNTSKLNLGQNYSVVLDFTFNEVNGYRKILDFLNRTSDTGFYNLNSSLNFYNGTTGPQGGLMANTPFEITLVNNNGMVSAYSNAILAPQFTFSDTSSLALITNNLFFFTDDLAVGGEAASGSVDRIRIYNSALNSSGITTAYLDRNNQGAVAVPGPIAGAGIPALLAFAGLFGFRRWLSKGAASA